MRYLASTLAACSAVGLLAAPAALAGPRDRDRDGLPDRWERSNGLSTKSKSAKKDTDRDGLRNRTEYRLRTKPRVKDTDRDGLSDGYEVRVSRTNPRRKNSRAGVPARPSPPRPRPVAATPPRPAPTPTPTPDPMPAPDPGPAPTPDLFVDGASVGGRCDDSRTAAQAASASTPWCSIPRAIAAAPEGRHVSVRAGRYPNFEITGDNRRSAFLSLAAHAGERVELGRVSTVGSSWLRFSGFSISGGVNLGHATHHVQMVGNDLTPAGFYLRNTRDVLIQGNRVHDLTTDARGLLAQGWDSRPEQALNRRLTIRGNRFSRMTYDAIAIYNGTEDLLIEDNEIEEVRKRPGSELHVDTIQIMGGTRMTVRRNLIHDSAHGMLFKDMTSAGLTIENNVVARTAGAGIQVVNAPGVRILSNTVWDTGAGLLLDNDPAVPGQTSATVVNNILNLMSAPAALTALEDHNLVRWSSVRGAHSSQGTAVFANAAANDFTLAAGSPGVDAATSDHGPERDRAGRARTDDPAVANHGGGAQPWWDMGAHER